MKKESKKSKRDNSHALPRFNLADFEPEFEEKLPRRFKEALNPPNILSKKERKMKEVEEEKRNNKSMTLEEAWIQVRPGETFPQYNARMKVGEKPFIVPPKIIQTTPTDFTDDATTATGSKRKERRKEYLRERKKTNRTKNDKDTPVNSTSQKRPLSMDVVKEPARITSKPKETFKANQKRALPQQRHTIDLTGNDRLGRTFNNDRHRDNKYDRRSVNFEKKRKPVKAKRYFELVKPEQHHPQ